MSHISEQVGEGHIDVNYNVDDSALNRSRDLQAEANKRYWAEYQKGFKDSLDRIDKSHETSANRRTSIMQDAGRKIQQALADSANNDGQIVNNHERSGSRSGNAFTNAFRRVWNTLKIKSPDIDIDKGKIDRHGRDAGNFFANGFEGILSMMPGRMETIFTKTGPVIGTALVTGLATAITVGAPFLGAALSGALVAGVGIAGVGGALALALLDDSPGGFKEQMNNALTWMSQAWAPILHSQELQDFTTRVVVAMNQVTGSLQTWAPLVNRLVEASSFFVGPLAEGLQMMVDGFLPPLVKLMESPFMKDIMNIFAKGLGTIGEALGDFFGRWLNDPQAVEGAKKGLEDLMNLIASTIRSAGDLLRWLSRVWESLNTAGGSDWKTPLDNVRDVLRDIGDIVGGIFSAFDLGTDKTKDQSSELVKSLKEVKSILDGISGNGGPDNKGTLGPVNDMLEDQNGKGAGLGRDASEGTQNERINKWGANQGDDLTAALKNKWTSTLDFQQNHFRAWIHNMMALFNGWMTNIKNWFDDAMRWIKNTWRTAWDWVKNTASGIWNSITGNISGWIQNIQNWFNNCLNWIRNTWRTSWTWVKDTAINIWNNITAFVAGWWQNIQNWYNNCLNWIKAAWDTAWGWVKDTAINIWGHITNALEGWWQNIQNWFHNGLEWIKNAWDVAWGWVKDKVQQNWDAVLNALDHFWGWIKNAFSVSLDWIRNTWNTAWEAVKNFFSDIWNKNWELIQNAWNNITNYLGDGLNKIHERWNTIWAAVHDTFVDIWGKIETKAGEGINNIINKLNSGISAINGVITKLGLSFSIPTIPNVSIGASAPQVFQGHADGGPIYGYGSGTSDSIPSWLSNGEHVWTAREVWAAGGHANVQAMRSAVLNGYAAGGGVERDGRLGFAGGGTTTQQAIIALAQKSGIPFTVTSSFRPGSTSLSGNADYHSQGMAVDFASPNMPGLAAFFSRYGAGLLEEIHSSGGGFFIKNGKRVSNSYYGAEVAGHFDHVHIAATLGAISQILSGGMPAGPGIAGGLGSALSLINEFVAKGWGWVTEHMLGPAMNGFTGGFPMTGVGQIGQGAANGMKKVFMEKIKTLFDEAKALADSVANSGNIGDMQVQEEAYKTAKSMGASPAVMMALFEAGFVESGFRNLQTATDHDSLGFLQQRPSAGWLNPLSVPAATRSFVSRAMGKSGSPGQIAQAVQVSAFPGRYDQMAGKAAAAIAALEAKFSKDAAKIVSKIKLPKFDEGGPLPPGWNTVYNGTGRTENVLSPGAGDALANRINGIGREGCQHVSVYVDGVEEKARKVVIKEIDKNNRAHLEHVRKGY